MASYFVQWVIHSITITYFDVQNVPQLISWSLFKLTQSQPLLITSLLAGKIRCSGLIWYFPSPTSPKHCESFMQQMIFPSQDMGIIIVPSPSQS